MREKIKNAEELVALIILYNPMDVHVYMYESRLESEGIKCFVMDRETASLGRQFSNIIGGTRLQVMKSDLKRALEIVDIVQEHLVEGRRFKRVLEKCPVCGSENAYFKDVSMLRSIFSLKRVHFCRDCQHTWKQPPAAVF